MVNSMIAYCGAAAVPDDAWSRWNCRSAVAGRARRAGVGGGPRPRRRRPCRLGALALMAVVFVSPLCALSSALFSVACAAPRHPGRAPWRLCWRWPFRSGAPAVSRCPRWSRRMRVILWLWHAPGAYAWGLAERPAYWLMQLSLLGSAWLMWRADPVAGHALGPRAGGAGGDDRADGSAGRRDRLRGAAALSGAPREHRWPGASRRSPTSSLPAC